MTQPGTRAQRLAMPLARDVVRELAIYARRVRPPGPATPHRPGNRPHRTRARPLRAHPRLGLPLLRRTGQDPAGGAVPGRLAPRPRAHRPGRRPRRRTAHVGRTARRRPARPRPGRRQRARTPPRTTRLIGDLDEQITRSGMRGNVLPARPVRRHRSTRRRQDTPDLPRRKVTPRTIGKTYDSHGRQDVPAVDVHHPHLPRLRARGKRRHPGRPGPLRLPAGGAGRAALRGAVRPVHPEPAPLPRPRRPVLRRRRTPAAPRPAHPHRHARHPVPHRAAPGPRRHLPPGLVATHRHRQARRRQPAGLARGQRQLPRPRHRRAPADLGPGPRRHRRRRTSRCTWPGSATGSTPRASSPDHATPTGASATSPST